MVTIARLLCALGMHRWVPVAYGTTWNNKPLVREVCTRAACRGRTERHRILR